MTVNNIPLIYTLYINSLTSNSSKLFYGSFTTPDAFYIAICVNAMFDNINV